MKYAKSIGILSLVLTCSFLGCSSSNSTVSQGKTSMEASSSKTPDIARSSLFDRLDWARNWFIREDGRWGEENLAVIDDETGRFDRVLRVRYPAGSASPRVSREDNAPLGGSQFYADLDIEPQASLRLSYYLRFSENFDFVKGGKLPGFFGGTVHSGGDIPDGTNGFSTRFMWRRNGKGEVYAYLPTSEEYGTSIGRGNWRFRPGQWYRLEQEVILNTPGESDGKIIVWVNGEKVVDRDNLKFRTTEDLKIEGILFSTFFGGGNSSWATPEDVSIYFADFVVSVD